MKTAEEWAEAWPDTDFDRELMMLNRIKQIQLDAMKEGMLRAADMYKRTAHLAENTEHYDLHIYMRACNNIDKRMNKAILTAADALAEPFHWKGLWRAIKQLNQR